MPVVLELGAAGTGAALAQFVRHAISQVQQFGLGLTLTLSIACGDDQPRALQPRSSGEPFPEEVHKSAKLGSIESDVTVPNGQQARVPCATCHSLVDTQKPAERPDELKDFHRGLAFKHGSLACVACHQAERPDALHLANGEKLSMNEALALCAQCHGPQKRSFDHGAHGGLNGHWDARRGPRLKNHCVDCHDPHAPQIPVVKPVLPPIDRGVVPRHAGGAHGQPPPAPEPTPAARKASR